MTGRYTTCNDDYFKNVEQFLCTRTTVFFYRPVYFYKPSDWRQSMKSDSRPENGIFDFLMTFSLRFSNLTL